MSGEGQPTDLDKIDGDDESENPSCCISGIHQRDLKN